jgi:hypothetical protein
MCSGTSNCGCGCQPIILEQQVGPQGPSGSSSSVIGSNYQTTNAHSAGMESIMLSQFIDVTKDFLQNDQDKLNIIAWFTGGPTTDITKFRIRLNDGATVPGSSILAALPVNSKSYRIKMHLELTKLGNNLVAIEGEVTSYGGTITGVNSFSSQAPYLNAAISTSMNLTTSNLYIFGTIESTNVSNNCSMNHLCVESKKYIV